MLELPDYRVLDRWPDRLADLAVGRYLVRIPVARLLSDHELTLTVHIVRGDDGPTLGLFAGIHGDEIPGVRCIREILGTIRAHALRGTVVAVPVCNPLAWQAQQRVTPERDVDRSNLARVFNSPFRDETALNTSGSLSRRIAHTLERTVYAALTHLVDYHCYGRDTNVRLMLFRTGQTDAAREMSAAMARAFGLGVIQGVRGSAGTTSAYAADRSIPTCVAEMGGTHTHRASEDAVVRLGAAGGLRVMHLLDMVDSAPLGPDRQLTVERTISVSPKVSGYYLPEYDLEDLFDAAYPLGIPVRAGQTLGHVFDTYTLKPVETLVAPDDGYLIGLFRGGPYQVGGPSLTIASGHIA